MGDLAPVSVVVMVRDNTLPKLKPNKSAEAYSITRRFPEGTSKIAASQELVVGFIVQLALA